MKNLFFLPLCFLFLNVSIGQSNIDIGEIAPEIHITDWIYNTPSDTIVKGKFIVLEFWATWCGPCITAIPHMNELQQKVEGKGIVFLSITDEPVDKVERLLERVDFNSIVVTDQAKVTQRKFGDGKEGLEAYPMTVLIDKEGVIKWIGEPKQLSADVLVDFVDGKLEGINHFNEVRMSEVSISEEKLNAGSAVPKSHFQTWMRYNRDEKIKIVHEFGETEEEETSNLQIKAPDFWAFYLTPISIKQIFHQVFKKEVIVPDQFRNKMYRLIYKRVKPDDTILERLEEDIVLTLGMSSINERIQVMENIVEIENEDLLKPALDEMFASKSGADDKIVFSSYSIEGMLDEVKNHFDIRLDYKGDNDGLYDFIIEIVSESKIKSSLASYGLKCEEKEIEIDVVKLTIKK